MEKQFIFKILRPKIAKEIKTISLFATCVIFLMGSAVHFYDSAVSGVNIISVFLLPIILFSMFREKYTVAGCFAFLGVGLLVVFSMIAVILELHPANLRLLRGALVSAAAVWGATWVVKHNQQIVPKVLWWSLFICASIAMLQISYSLIGIGLDPAANFSNLGFHFKNEKLMGIPSIFVNPNDFSVFACLIFLYFFIVRGDKLSIVVALSLFCILISGSKTAVIIAVVGLFINGGHLNIKSLAFVSLLGSCFVCYLLLNGFIGSNFYAIDRLFFTVIEMISGSLDSQSSASVRYESWAYFFHEYSSFLVGTFSAGRIFPQFLNAPFDTSVISLNPHSFIIELHALFGFGGLIISVALFFSIYKCMSRNYTVWSLIYVFCSIFLLVNVPSSILGSGSTYALIALLAVSPIPGPSVLNLSEKLHHRSSLA